MTESVVGAMRDAGHWNPLWDGVAELDPEWTESFMRTTMSTYRGGVLTPQVVELVVIGASTGVVSGRTGFERSVGHELPVRGSCLLHR
ncbi:hypothetical protein HWD35_02480 [Tsukamurella tyrosinosolvens]|uniref:hypothetical protein n=1 Tax=Tsukamurella tyrosinosolvens TaxID=57704 RepID=UPI00079256E7|nr:hypothetical protein [Tsukamurella tyrosinosolvens]KXP05817.1 hypothetical protein AXK59_09970 [Tsukamurella tyrosinosolvens]KZL95650.1 hypothetical protein AXX05_21065 [Tsukamurella tyrosinosolvens]MCA4993569.1 hypothetical protein [Tsukamurella tyrosinosolvens]QRY83106.1 hypothetical protein JVY00_14590 [Tsukamurella tyrosinosolvens]